MIQQIKSVRYCAAQLCAEMHCGGSVLLLQVQSDIEDSDEYNALAEGVAQDVFREYKKVITTAPFIVVTAIPSNIMATTSFNVTATTS